MAKKIGSIAIQKNPNFPSGTSLQAYIKTNRGELRKVFGNPNMGESADGKSKGKEWNLIVGGKRVTIYDKRERGKKGTKYFNIGGSGKFGALLVAQALSIHRNKRVHAKETVPKWLEDKGHYQQVKSIDEHPDLTYQRAKEYWENTNRYRAESFSAPLGGMIPDASEPQRMEQSELEYIFNSLKPKQAISVWFNSAVRSADDWTELQVGRKSKSKKYNLEKISLINPKNPKGSKYYLYNRQGRISFAMGDMGTSLIAIKTNGKNAESFSADHPKFDPQKADRNKDGKISSWERTVGNEVAKSMAAEDVTWMIDSSKYEGHTPGPWIPHKQDFHGSIMIKKRDDYWMDIGQMKTTADKLLAADAPKILYGYKKQMDVLTTLDEKIRNGESHADLMKALEQGLGLPETWKEMGAESFSADERKLVQLVVEYYLPGDPEYIYDLLEGANMKIIEMKDYYGAESFSADDQTRHYKNLGIGAALVAGLAYWIKR